MMMMMIRKRKVRERKMQLKVEDLLEFSSRLHGITPIPVRLFH